MTHTPPTAKEHDALNRPKRFWKEASVGPREDAGFPVLLDGRRAKTPAGAALVLPTEPLARLVAREWADSGEYVVYAAMPATRLAFTTIDRIGGARDAVAGEVAKYAGSDLLCYFAEEPSELYEREAAAWGPLLDWAEADLGLRFVRAAGIVHQSQPAETVERVKALALELDDFRLAGLSWAAGLFGSAVLAFALARGRLGGGEAFDLSRLDETFQNELWGVDEEAAERAAALRTEAELLERWFEALG